MQRLTRLQEVKDNGAEYVIYRLFEYTQSNILCVRRYGNTLRDSMFSDLKWAIHRFGLDFGYTDPNAFVCCMIDNKTARIYVFDEWYKNSVTNKTIADTIKNMGYGSEPIICDCAGSQSIRELRELNIRAKPSAKGPDSVTHGIHLIQNYKICVHPKCKKFKEEILNYCWEKTKDGRLTGRPDHEFSHGMDAMRYAVAKALRPPIFSFD